MKKKKNRKRRKKKAFCTLRVGGTKTFDAKLWFTFMYVQNKTRLFDRNPVFSWIIHYLSVKVLPSLQNKESTNSQGYVRMTHPTSTRCIPYYALPCRLRTPLAKWTIPNFLHPTSNQQTRMSIMGYIWAPNLENFRWRGYGEFQGPVSQRVVINRNFSLVQVCHWATFDINRTSNRNPLWNGALHFPIAHFHSRTHRPWAAPQYNSIQWAIVSTLCTVIMYKHGATSHAYGSVTHNCMAMQVCIMYVIHTHDGAVKMCGSQELKGMR